MNIWQQFRFVVPSVRVWSDDLALPSGTLIPYAGQLTNGQVPNEINGGGANPLFLPCDGGVYLQDEFGGLFDAIGQEIYQRYG